MTLEKAKKLLAVQADFGGFYNCNGAKLILAEVQREHGQAAVDGLIRDLELERIFGFASGTHFGWKLTGTRRNWISAGAVLSQPCRSGSNSPQCGHP